MRLATIKLAGFKSFVDPTTLHLPTNLTAVVGPNGCGKSNIIDAVRWVLGESAASRLRGDAMTDVIFNGTTERKPVGQASVELIFDNSQQTLLGPWAAYQEISVKRVVGRDGLSHYWLNGTRCRRRDITDLFLGTGLGPRSYSIIEQGMISQIVESAPEELRVYLEEAAGISKYKDRRKETEQRIRATRENLERLLDVREEVDKQLEHLRRQARQAERWTELKAEHRRVEAEIRVLRRRSLCEQLEGELARRKDAEKLVDQLSAEQARNEAETEKARAEQSESAEHFRAVQAEHYQVGAEIARLEQQLSFHRQNHERLTRELAEAEAQLAHLREQERLDREQLALLAQTLARDEPRLAELVAAAARQAELQQAAEAALHAWQQRMDASNREWAEASQAAEVERTRIDYLDRQLRQSLQRNEAIARELEQIEARRTGEELAELRAAMVAAEADVQRCTDDLEARQQRLAEAEATQREATSELDRQRQAISAARGRLAALEALQHAALGEDRRDLAAWLRQHGLAAAPRLGALLAVEAGWEAAVETALGMAIEAIVVEGVLARELSLEQLPKGVLTLVDPAVPVAPAAADTLAAKVQGPAVVGAWLGTIRSAADLAEARTLAATLAPHESVITRDGHWFGPGWRRIDRGRQGHEGVIERGREIEALKQKIAELDQAIRGAEVRVGAVRAAVAEALKARDAAQSELYSAHRRLADASGRVKAVEGRVEQERQRRTALSAERAQLAQQTKQLEEQQRAARGRLEVALSRLAQIADQRTALEAERSGLIAARDQARVAARAAQEAERELALAVAGQGTAVRSLEAAIARIEAQLSQLAQRRQTLQAQIVDNQEPIAGLEQALRVHLDQRVLVDQRLTAARHALEEVDRKLRRCDQERQRLDYQLAQAREQKAAIQLAEQALRIKVEDITEALAADGHDGEAVLAALDPAANLPAWEARAAELEQRIRKLEPVNLAAIKELEELSERKTYLDAQHADLTQALATLEEAIRKIDRETRTRFKETFDRVNAGLQELFPRLFGGGHALLELTSEDLLTTGVQIIARPPGKKPASIGLLSGGEKALTAVALIFAIFRLNPAPFCLLDEVDAPLDEANVGRFCQMVVEMSRSVQFLIVTHNKVTMESVSQLAGVTMREPGVSRLVSVDLAEAAKLAGA
jgi:chromosome segregation protein